MKRFKISVLILVVVIFSISLYAGDVDISKVIIGKWNIAANQRVKSGDITFTADGKYDMNEKFADGSGSGTKGGYKLDCEASPVRLKLCLGGCPGSEWTNQFGIVRLLPEDKLEILLSPDGNYPTKFLEDKSTGSTMILSRME